MRERHKQLITETKFWLVDFRLLVFLDCIYQTNVKIKSNSYCQAKAVIFKQWPVALFKNLLTLVHPAKKKSFCVEISTDFSAKTKKKGFSGFCAHFLAIIKSKDLLRQVAVLSSGGLA